MHPSRRTTTQWELFFQYLTVPLGMISGIVLVPLYLKLIPQNVYGAWLATGNVLAWLTLADPGLSGVMRQRVAAAYGRGQLSAIGEMVFAGVAVTSGVTLLVVAIGLVVSQFLPAILHLPDTPDTLLIVKAFSITMVGTGCTLFYFTLDSVGKGLQSTFAMGMVQTAVRLAYLGFIIALLLSGAGLLALAYGQLFNGIALCVVGALVLRRRLRVAGIPLRVTFRRVPELASLLSFTFLGRAASVISANLDLVLTASFLGTTETTVLALTRRVPESIRPLVDRPAYAFLPAVSHLYGANEIDKARAVLLRLSRFVVWVLGLFFTGFLLLNAGFVRLWIGADFYAGHAVNTLICVGIVLAVIEASLNGLCFAMGDVKGTSIVGAIRGLVCVALLLVLGRRFGMTGLVAAPVLAILVVSLAYLLWSFCRRLNLDHAQRRQFLMECGRVLLAGLVAALPALRPAASTWLEFGLHVGGVAALYLVTLAICSADFRREFVAFQGAIKSKLFRHG